MAGFRDIIVHVDRLAASTARLDMAFALAHRCAARLHALFAIADPALPGFASRFRLPIAAPEAADMEVAFNERCAAEGLTGTWTTKVASDAADISREVILRGRFADVILLGRHETDTADGSVPDDLADQAIMRSGRPVLVVPSLTAGPAFGERVVIAWNGSREAARAVHDALPLLPGAKRVTVLALTATGLDNRFGDSDPEGLVDHLAAHGIAAEADRLVFDAAAIDTGERLLSLLADASCDLLVIGGPGHITGATQAKRSVTRHVLSHTIAPALVSF